MNTKSLKHWSLLLLIFTAPALAPAAPGMITTTLSSMGPVLVGETVTATFRISGYTDATEIDGFNFKVNFPGSVFSFVPGSDSTGTLAPGPDQQWLAKSAQDDGFSLNALVAPSPGQVTITAFDSGVGDTVTGDHGGTLASSGFLVSFNLLTIGMGTGDITLSPFVGGGGPEVLLDTVLMSAGVPTLSGASLMVVPEPGVIALLATGGIGLLVFRLKRRA